jgi:hypothetical protein
MERAGNEFPPQTDALARATDASAGVTDAWARKEEGEARGRTMEAPDAFQRDRAHPRGADEPGQEVVAMSRRVHAGWRPGAGGATGAALAALVACAVGACSGASNVLVAQDGGGRDGAAGGSSSGSGGSGSGSGGSGGGGGDGAAGSDGSGGADGAGHADGGASDGSSGCTNLECQVAACSTGTTTLTGTVLDPAGRNPVYDAVVYVPNSPGGALDPLPLGVGPGSCGCDGLFSGSVLTAATTDIAGTFTLSGVPSGANIPVVVQLGKWRKEIVVPAVTSCQANAAGPITLPKNLTDGLYASLPNVAVSTGAADTLECVLARMGVDPAMYTGAATGAGVHVFQGGGGYAASGGSPAPETALWDSVADLSRYDLVLLSCEGEEDPSVTGATATTLAAYLDAGGKVFAEHYHYAFFTTYATTPGTPYPEFANVADWTEVGLTANDEPYVADVDAVVETALPRGAALKAWLATVGALGANGELVVPVANARANAVVGPTNAATAWLETDPSVTPASTQYFSWDMPLPSADAGAPKACGRVAYTDMHASGSLTDYTSGSTVVPAGCATTAKLTNDEAAMEYILFELSSCPALPTP